MTVTERVSVVLPGIRHTCFLWWGKSWRDDPRSQQLMELNPWIDNHTMIRGKAVIVFPLRGQEILGLKEICGTTTQAPFCPSSWPNRLISAVAAILFVTTMLGAAYALIKIN